MIIGFAMFVIGYLVGAESENRKWKVYLRRNRRPFGKTAR